MTWTNGGVIEEVANATVVTNGVFAPNTVPNNTPDYAIVYTVDVGQKRV